MLTPADTTILVRAIIAAALGFAVGWEREAHGHSAGIRTIALVTMGGAILTATATQFFGTPDRIIANIITGVGFLGAGIILHDSANRIRGATTAASIWTMTSISIVVGLGHLVAGVMLTLLVLLLLWWQFLPIFSQLRPQPVPEAEQPEKNLPQS